MCTVSYLPTPEGGFILTSNRDEAPKRSAAGLYQDQSGDKTLLFPRDPLAQGTWIAASDAQQLVCVLNGAFVKHQHRPPYRLSRGIMALRFFDYPNAQAFFETFDFSGIEPFTMVIYDAGELYELRWDEQKTHVLALPAEQQHIWASCTLYPTEWQQKRQDWFQDWQKQYPQPDQKAILDFHRTAGEGNAEYDLVMNRQEVVRTTSITSVVGGAQGMQLRYEDLLNGEVLQASV